MSQDDDPEPAPGAGSAWAMFGARGRDRTGSGAALVALVLLLTLLLVAHVARRTTLAAAAAAAASAAFAAAAAAASTTIANPGPQARPLPKYGAPSPGRRVLNPLGTEELASPSSVPTPLEAATAASMPAPLVSPSPFVPVPRPDLEALSAVSPLFVALGCLNLLVWLLGLITSYVPWGAPVQLPSPKSDYKAQGSLIGGAVSNEDANSARDVHLFHYASCDIRCFYAGYDGAEADRTGVSLALFCCEVGTWLAFVAAIQALLVHREVRRKITWIRRGIRKADCCVEADHPCCCECCCCCDGAPDCCDGGPEGGCGPHAAFANCWVAVIMNVLLAVLWGVALLAGSTPFTWRMVTPLPLGPGFGLGVAVWCICCIEAEVAAAALAGALGAAAEPAPPPPPGFPPLDFALADVAVGGPATTGGFGGPMSTFPTGFFANVVDATGCFSPQVQPGLQDLQPQHFQLQQLHQMRQMRQQVQQQVQLEVQQQMQLLQQSLPGSQSGSGLSPAQEAELAARRRGAAANEAEAQSMRRSNLATTAQQLELMDLRAAAVAAAQATGPRRRTGDGDAGAVPLFAARPLAVSAVVRGDGSDAALAVQPPAAPALRSGPRFAL